jgi:hypothetical protein
MQYSGQRRTTMIAKKELPNRRKSDFSGAVVL